MTPHDTLHNAAALMLLLSSEEAASIFSQLPPEQAHQLKTAITLIAQKPKPAPPNPLDLDVNFDEFEDATRQSRLISDSSRYVKAMLNQAFGLQSFAIESRAGSGADASTTDASAGGTTVDRVVASEGPGLFDPSSMLAPPPAHGAGFERLRRAELGTVVQMLVAEHPQIAAAILTQLDLVQSTRVLQNIPPRQRSLIVQRIARTGALHPATLDTLDEMLVTLLNDGEARRHGAQSGARRAAMLISGMGAHMEASMLESIDSTDPALAQRILDKMDEEHRP
jgi:flagellar motor switch protein FliG